MNLGCLIKTTLCIFSLLVVYTRLSAQDVQSGTLTNGSEASNIITGVPFLLITPDARSGSMGDVGVAVQPDGNAMVINPSKLAFLDKKYGFAVSYSPWLKSLVPDVSLTYISGFYKPNEKTTIGGSLRYFNLGEIQLTDINQQDLGIYTPNELAADITYARQLDASFSLGTTLRYIYSNLTSGQFSSGQQTSAANAVAVDVSAYFKKPTIFLGSDAILAAGINISNVGTKLSYSERGNSYFLPTNLKIGGASTFLIDDYNQFTFALDFNKLLVPTQPIYDENGKIIAGKDPNRSVPSGIFGSFSDAPGGFKEEVREINIAAGMEYWYNQQFALRTGYFYESPTKGNRRYFTLGAGLKYNVFNIDISYLVANVQKSPLANTLRFTMLFNFGMAGN
ncbi:MAG: type IX secretion system outer membrane channel protein PorV [Candidatus Pedobacter colombiensis]|uniref:Type IX secretion system outer membrane channel protein PorV n=1 Tax=Candidatus Pedobacter colombiensis TaxID=3121371 RepID=A0AAJ5W9P6_9SPHI|nr:type IX secretion system outer membrane channel protein PorV [Pedobacter sp.]WEK19589.1 MAG: type IX secretion system outer membrane channel protein PorV [Pedobacter sp.]